MMTSRIWFTAAQKAELWERWKNGQSAAHGHLPLAAEVAATGFQRDPLTVDSQHGTVGESFHAATRNRCSLPEIR
jgi:hypothetical protein